MATAAPVVVEVDFWLVLELVAVLEMWVLELDVVWILLELEVVCVVDVELAGAALDFVVDVLATMVLVVL